MICRERKLTTEETVLVIELRTHHLSTMNPTLWKDCEGIYSPADEITRAQQDEGTTVTARGEKQDMKHKLPLIEKLASKIYNEVQKRCDPECLTKNLTRGKQSLLKEIILSRKSMDVTEAHTFLHTKTERYC
jgi:hypothetical protein